MAKYYVSNGEVLLFKNSYKIKPQGVCYVFNSCGSQGREGIEVHIPCVLGSEIRGKHTLADIYNSKEESFTNEKPKVGYGY